MKVLILCMIPVLCWSCHAPAGHGTEASETTQAPALNCDQGDAPGMCFFQDMPEGTGSVMQIGGEDGEQSLIIRGQVLNAKTNEPIANLPIYGFQTNKGGLYEKAPGASGIERWHGKWRGWCVTDDEGRYEIRTFRPGPYPSGDLAAHIHLYVMFSEEEIHYINDIVFPDDPLVNDNYLKTLNSPVNPAALDNGITPLTIKDGVAYGNRDIVLQVVGTGSGSAD